MPETAMSMKKWLGPLIALALSGCVSLAVKGAKVGSEELIIQTNLSAANAGDPVAQYRVGAAHCCAIGLLDKLHDNDAATHYLCLSAYQNYAPAQYLLGRIYEGHPIAGIDPQQEAKLLAIGSPKNLPLGDMWLTLAAENGDRNAPAALQDLSRRLSAADAARATVDLANWRAVPCTWSAVFAKS